MLKFREYGTHIQKWAEKLTTITDSPRRQALAKEIIRMMSVQSPGQYDSEEYQRKLWDHLYAITNYQYDLGGPFPAPSPESETATAPKHIEYQQVRTGINQYGTLIKRLIQRAIAITEEQARLELVNIIVNVMKQVMVNARQSALRDETLLEHLNRLSEGKLVYSREQLDIKNIQRRSNNQPTNNQQYRNNKNRNRNSFDRNRHKRK